MRVIRTLALGLVLTACHEAPSAQPEPLPFTLGSAEVWSGGDLAIVSAAFAQPAPLPVVLIDAETLSVRRADDTTLIATLPDLPGAHAIRVRSPAVLPVEAPLILRGFVDWRLGPLFGGRTVPGAHATEVFGNGPTRLRRWDVSSDAVLDYPDTVHAVACTRGVGSGPASGQLVLNTGSCAGAPRWALWQVEPQLVWLDSVRSAVSNRWVVALAATRYVIPGPHLFQLMACDSTPCGSVWPRGESGIDVVQSPREDRAALVAYVVSDSGAPVVDVASGALSYTVPPFRAVGGAAFSSSGDTLFIAGQDHAATGGPGILTAVRAADGLALASTALPFWASAVAVDQTRPWLYVAGADFRNGGWVASLEVLDRRTLAPITTLGIPAGIVTAGLGFCRILPSPLERRVYLVETEDGDYNPGARPRLFRFDTP